MGELFGRSARLQMGTVLVEGLRIAFRIQRDNRPEPNSAEISVWNLAASTRAKLAAQNGVPVILQAGYGADIEQVFSGDIRTAGISSVCTGADWVTTLKAGDGLDAYRTARIQKSFGRGVKFGGVLKELGSAMKVGLGGSLDKLKAGDVKGALTEFFGGTVVSGQCTDELTRLCASAGLEWSIQDGKLVVVEKGGHTDEPAVLLRADSGLISSPEPGKDGVTKFKSLLQPRITPCRRVKVESSAVNGYFVVSKVTHTGDTHGAEWYSDCEGLPL